MEGDAVSETTASKARKLQFYALSQQPAGLCLRELADQGESPQVMQKTLHNLRDAGLIHGVETGWRETRWFDTQARADAYLAAHPFKRVGREARQGVRCPAGPAVNTVQVQVCPGIERMHQPVKLTQPVFSAMRPGQYL